jgi:hypothetical protein
VAIGRPGYAAPVEPARLESLDRGLWAIARPFRALDRLEVGSRMTVLGLEDGGLLLHSPVQLDDSHREAIGALGPVRAIVAPNLWHHLFLGPAADAFPAAERWAAPGLPWRRKDLSFHGELGRAHPIFPGVDWHVIGGSRLLGEVLFFHRATRTLVVTDLFFHVLHRDQPLARAYYTLSGTYGRFASSRVIRAAVWDREAARETAHWILDRDPSRVTVCHGDVFTVTPGSLESALRWLLV